MAGGSIRYPPVRGGRGGGGDRMAERKREREKVHEIMRDKSTELFSGRSPQ